MAALVHAADENAAARVVILANSTEPASLQVARHYAEVRGVPAENLVALPMSRAEQISWPEFIATIWTPLLDELVRRKWIEATPMDLTDNVGRRKYAAYRHRMSALVVCRGVPLKIDASSALYSENRPSTNLAPYRTNAGAVDAELSLLAQPNYPISGFVENPLFKNDQPTIYQRERVVEVGRLDGATVDDALALVDHAIVAERQGVIGRAYIDLAKRDLEGDAWLESAAKQLSEAGFDTSVDREAATMPPTARCDAAAFYFGWYTWNLDGPFALPGYRFPPGAVAMHIQSYSASSLRSATTGWSAPLIARGAAATVGNVFEPYLLLTHHPDLMVRALIRGASLGEAAYYALPALSWQAVLIGDPLYRPFAVTLDEQLKNLGQLPPRLAGYVVVRKMHLLDAANRRAAADALADQTQRERPSLALGVALARRRIEAGDREAAGRALEIAAKLKSFATDEWALAREAAQLLESAGRPARAVEVWRTLLAEPIPGDIRIAWLREARETARAAGDPAQESAWEVDLVKAIGAAGRPTLP